MILYEFKGINSREINRERIAKGIVRDGVANRSFTNVGCKLLAPRDDFAQLRREHRLPRNA